MKKLSPDEMFPDFEPGTTGSNPQQAFPDPMKTSADEFVYDKSLLKGIASDPGVRAEIERLVEARMRDSLKEEIDSLMATAERQGYEQGFQKGFQSGLAEGATEWKSLRESLNTICETVTAEKANLLINHEKEWLGALEHIVKESLIPSPEKTIQGVSQWLEKKVREFGDQGKVRLKVAPALFERFKKAIPESSQPKWEIVSDPTVNAEQLLVEFDSHGYVFSPQGCLTEVCELLKGAVR